MKLTEHFTVEEMTKTSQPYDNSLDGIKDEKKGEHIRENLLLLCQMYLEPLRDHFGPIIVNSGYRSKVVNAAVGGAKNSYHLLGKAADIKCRNFQEMVLMASYLLYWNKNYVLNINTLAELIMYERGKSYWIHLAMKKDGNDKTENFGYKKKL